MATIVSGELIGRVIDTAMATDASYALDLNLAAGQVTIVNGVEFNYALTAQTTSGNSSGTLGFALTSEGSGSSLGNGMAGADETVAIQGAGIGLIFLADYDIIGTLSTNGATISHAHKAGVSYRSLDYSNRPWTTEIPMFISKVVDSGIDLDVTVTVWYQIAQLGPEDLGRGAGALPFGSRIVRLANIPNDGGFVQYYT